MTELDKKILFQLDKDGRASYSMIAREIGTSAQVVKYHVEQLLEKGVVKHFWAFIDYDKADYAFFWGYWLKFSGLTKEIEEIMYQDFIQNPYIPIVMRTDGYADAMLGIIAKDVFHHHQTLQSVFATYGKFISASDLVVGLGFHKFPRTHLVGKENELSESSISGGFSTKEKLSELDRKILSILQLNGRMEFTKIAGVLGVSSGLVQKHVRRLEEKNIITKITYTLDYKKTDLTLYRVLLKIRQSNPERIELLYQFCLKHPNIINYVNVMGTWQLMLDIEISDRLALRDLMRSLKELFGDVITQMEINEVYQIDKFTQMAIEYPDILKRN